jgi:hypothetical protein
MSFRYLDDEEEERIIDVELNLVAFIKNKTMWLDIKNTVWERVHFETVEEMNEVIKKLKVVS